MMHTWLAPIAGSAPMRAGPELQISDFSSITWPKPILPAVIEHTRINELGWRPPTARLRIAARAKGLGHANSGDYRRGPNGLGYCAAGRAKW
jgi:hypothetical protein